MRFFLSFAIAVAGFSLVPLAAGAIPIQSTATDSAPATVGQAGPRRPGPMRTSQLGSSLSQEVPSGPRRVAPGTMDQTLSAEK